MLALSGCARYSARPLSNLARKSSFIADTSESYISFDYHVFNKGDCKRCLDRDVIAAGYQPVHINVCNNTSRYLDISLARFNVPMLAPEDVAEEFHTSTAGRAAGYGIASLILWPLFIPAIVDGVGSAKANKHLSADFSRKSFRINEPIFR